MPPHALILILLAVCGGRPAAACVWADAEEWVCVPCGGAYSCHGTGACYASEVPGCALPPGTSEWLCCDASECDVTSPNPCTYSAPAPPLRHPHRHAAPAVCLGGPHCDCALGNVGNACVLTVLVLLLSAGAGVACCGWCACRWRRARKAPVGVEARLLPPPYAVNAPA